LKLSIQLGKKNPEEIGNALLLDLKYLVNNHLWASVIGGEVKVHNSHMDVVVTLW
jgi:hypothetical protein